MFLGRTRCQKKKHNKILSNLAQQTENSLRNKISKTHMYIPREKLLQIEVEELGDTNLC